MVPSLKYLGTSLDGGNHVQVRKQAAQRAFYSIQGAGVKYGGVSPATAVNIYNAAVCSVILYGCSSIHLSNCNLRELDKMQSKHVKCIMGLKSSSRTTVLLQSLSIILFPNVGESCRDWTGASIGIMLSFVMYCIECAIRCIHFSVAEICYPPRFVEL